MIKTFFNFTSIEPTPIIESTPSPQKVNPPVSQPVEDVKPRETGIKKPTPAAPSLTTQSSAGTLRPPAVNQNLMSPIGNMKKRKTMVDPSGNKHVVTDSDLNVPSSPQGRGRYGARKNKKTQEHDIFGDFFGFGPNPPGCMSKGTDAIDLKKEKEKFLGLLGLEAKRYDVQGMHVDLNGKME